MGFFDIFKSKKITKYGPTVTVSMSSEHDNSNALKKSKNISKKINLDNIDSILSISVPSEDCNLYYTLQRKATEHKRNGNMDLAIACLRKSNELSDYFDRPPLLEKDYIRLVKYLQKAGKPLEAEKELKLLYNKHPEFLDKRISNKKRILSDLARYQRMGYKAVHLYTDPKCPICGIYNQKIYSISKTRKFPQLPPEILEGGFCKNCIICVSAYTDI
ncbi:MAG: hypothetical protein K2M73_10685 [Lachnospiraceae bacterium]|nr:hypothetical protein [Lachnospiraceae bacterium]